MPYVIAPQSLMTFTIRGIHESQQIMSVFTYRYNGSQQIVDGEAALLAAWAQFQGAATGVFDKWIAVVSNKVTDIKTQIQWTHPDRFAYIEMFKFPGTEGGVAGAAMPVNTSVAITKRTQNAGRGQVGTLHMPGVPQSFVVDGRLTPAANASYTELADRVKLTLSTVNIPMELLPVLFKESSPTVSNKIHSAEVKPFARVMRRRTVGLGS